MFNNNKKGDMFLEIITLIIMLIVFFNIAPALNELAINMLSLNPDSLTTWLLRGTVYFLLLGILVYARKITTAQLGGGGFQE